MVTSKNSQYFLKIALYFVELDHRCNMVLIGPVNITTIDDPTNPEMWLTVDKKCMIDYFQKVSFSRRIHFLLKRFLKYNIDFLTFILNKFAYFVSNS